MLLRSGFPPRQYGRRAIHAGAALTILLGGFIGNPASAATPPEILLPHVPQARLAGEGQLRWLGLPIYAAQLWTHPGFNAGELDRHAFALELRYLRDFRSQDIARRSLVEMKRAGAIDEATSTRWQSALARAIPDVKSGDRIMGVHRPGLGALFLHNGKPSGEIADPVFAARFFSIWLGPATSEPALRDSLLGKATR